MIEKQKQITEFIYVIARSTEKIAESLDRLAQDQAEFHKLITEKIIMDEKRPGSGIPEQKDKPKKQSQKKPESKPKSSNDS